ncbi:23S rRNA (uracil(1939)-C(5))-methyltransferase RlmD [Alteromonas gilva]|uniref:23S rRNA (Uracil(1939)-C(5))-methyltransferase RlmD n=1 Tax=Alteromonas gilva TaxID=2987522 RepID=A0ABT5KZI3_9ALTE|nr:23S rRNA (uracil(1939)-C(5))-methyltransferase RlmD [Alteromonas gilva]MDC8830042.1 23S rRNA (uracil(1939)-C(5))-methyltransferase RlmD [Alteromonas gilva]
MVSFYNNGKNNKPGKRGKPHQASNVTVTIDAWDARGRGVCRNHKPVLFVDGALPGEVCEVTVTAQKKQLWEGHVKRVVEPVNERQQPFCPLYTQCGGCQLQHVTPHAALGWRQEALDSQMRRQHKLESIHWTVPISSPQPRYRRKTRLAIDARKGKPLALGYRSQQSDKIVNVEQCPVLHDSLNQLLPPLHQLVQGLLCRTHLGHISLLNADNGIGVTLRCTRSPGADDRQKLQAFAEAHQLTLTLDLGDTAEVVYQPTPALYCDTAEQLKLTVSTEDFVQVNREVNLAMIEQALDWLSPAADDHVLDLFCGLGNFTLPLAKRCKQVTAVEGIATMVQRGQQTARKQGITNIKWCAADLSDAAALATLEIKNYHKVLLDPSREGALAACEHIARSKVKKVVYVSCNPATFNRDLAVLLAAGYQLVQSGLMEMFPYTQHVELMALLEYKGSIRGKR